MPITLETVNCLNYNSRLRSDRAVEQNFIQRQFLTARKFFSGGIEAYDRQKFDEFYVIYKGRITQLGQEIEAGQNLTLNFGLAKKFLEALARFQICSMESSLKNYQPFLEFAGEVKNLRDAAAAHSGDIEAQWEFQKEDIRWIHSDHQQRLFAACSHGSLPHKYEELPAGSVILYNPEAWQTMHYIKGKKPRNQFIWKIKALFCEFFTGKTYIHAELAMGKGKTFDLDNKGLYGTSKVEIKDRTGMNCFFDVVAPNKEMISPALMEQIVQEGEANGPKVDSTLWELLKVGIWQKPRPADYDCTTEWNPGVNRFACSGTIAALFGKFGIDIGKALNKKVENISPADFTRSPYFKPF